ncbi:hypothetical protein [Elizabethkingia anophelis]|uniref:hypothetical protein n=1 Tax=Elizabethkingia anophelis TaxID=1117645 RepID=UPI000C6D155A|nr:hypothetical protein [Elizabethkingia anophelis]PKR31108.1 hypothetical protein CWH99_09960 [Elizabethkingia anophelis]PKR36755.1 hypothetical protein CWI00_06440 [Elizabethkingia anophelis]PRQ79715.1 hypothetical protein CMT60_05640 [Elizabethkingia anophelis]PRQ84050.1 hypothetical protein CMT86_18590 [Elizabethkingia anophelis]PRQ85744.1 hypothetical protein CMT87_06270 [Elizabethkingia anophelis]
MKKILLSAVMLSCIIACRQDGLSNENNSQQTKQNLYDVKSVYKQEFSIALAKALTTNSDLRDFIKNEALKKFDNDYDVLYQMVKDEIVGGKKFKDIIAEQYEKKENLEALERLYPTLTIFIPELPMNSFSAERWDSKTEIPQVAYTLNTTSSIPIVNGKGEENFLDAKYIPSFPVLVVKENERVKVSTGINDKVAATNKNAVNSILKGTSYSFEFLDDAFNGGKSARVQRLASTATNMQVNTPIIDSKVQQAYDIYKNADGWQRDYIYYDITPGQQRGQFKYDFQEYLTSFSMNDAKGLSIISDQAGDPVNNFNYVDSRWNGDGPKAPWTGGNFEFKVHVLINASNGVGASIDKYFSVSPSDLYDAKYIEVGPLPVIRGIFQLESMTPKRVPLNIPLFNWDLSQYASSIKISIEEVDLTEEETRTDTRSVKFATNFGVDTDGLIKKIGLKFGASLEKTESSTVTYKVTKSSDQLGDVIVNFADNVITNINGSYGIRNYSSGLYTIVVEPKRVQ